MFFIEFSTARNGGLGLGAVWIHVGCASDHYTMFCAMNINGDEPWAINGYIITYIGNIVVGDSMMSMALSVKIEDGCLIRLKVK